MNDTAGGTTPREEVFKAIEHRNPNYVPGWLNFFAGETRDRHGEALAALSDSHEDDVVVSVLSTFPPMAEMPPGWADEWACTWNHSPDGVGAVSVDSPLTQSWERLSWYLEHGLPGLGQRTDILDRVSDARVANPDRYLMATTYLAVFERLRCLRGAENLMTDFYLHPEELAVLRDAIAQEFADSDPRYRRARGRCRSSGRRLWHPACDADQPQALAALFPGLLRAARRGDPRRRGCMPGSIAAAISGPSSPT